MKREPLDIAKKVSAATLGAAVATIVLALIPGREDPELQGAVTTGAVFLAGYLVKGD